jgi:hypothetical protein
MKTTMMDRMVDKGSKEPDYEENKERLEEEQKEKTGEEYQETTTNQGSTCYLFSAYTFFLKCTNLKMLLKAQLISSFPLFAKILALSSTF